MQYIAIIIMIIFSLLGGAIGYSIKDSTPPVIVYRNATSTCEQLPDVGNMVASEELTELSIKLSNAEIMLEDCKNDYLNNCYREKCEEPEECEVCEDFSVERQEHLELEDSLMKKADDCREAEKRLREEYEDYKAKYNFN